VVRFCGARCVWDDFVSVIVSEEGEVLNCSPLPEVARVLVRFNHVASGIVNPDDSVV
jgi:hypothetical protein